MSWQCPTCETVNQDITPVCTVCDNIAPVIQSYLALESIDRIREYNDKLNEIHIIEGSQDYNKMLNLSLEAISIYQENHLAVDKAKHALRMLQKNKILEKLLLLLNDAVTRKDLKAATSIIELATNLEISSKEIDVTACEIKIKLSRKQEVDRLLEKSYNSLIELKTDESLKIIEKGLLDHPDSQRLKKRRDDIKELINSLKRKSEEKGKQSPGPPRKVLGSGSTSPYISSPPVIIDSKPKKPKHPKVTRK